MSLLARLTVATWSDEQKSTTKELSSNDAIDWRIRLVSHLAKDVPGTAAGAPAHKAGALILGSTLGRDANGRLVSFATPSAIALALDLAIKAAERAQTLQAQLNQSEGLTPFGSGTSITLDSTPVLFEYLQHCMTALAFSFQALEAFCNETISLRLSGTYPLQRKKVISHVTADELERQTSTEEKLGTILPKLLGVVSPKGSRVWNDYVELKRTRDATIHIKSHDLNPKVMQPSDLDDASLFHRFLGADASAWVRAAVAMLDYFAAADADPPRWLEPAKNALGMRRNPQAPNQKKRNVKPRGKR